MVCQNANITLKLTFSLDDSTFSQRLLFMFYWCQESVTLIRRGQGVRRQIWKVVSDLRLTASCLDRGNQFRIWCFPICTVSYLARTEGIGWWGSNNQILDESSWPWDWVGPGEDSPGLKKQCISCGAGRRFLLSLSMSQLSSPPFSWQTSLRAWELSCALGLFCL